MGHARIQERPLALLEEGTISFHYRPRVEEQAPEELGDVQRLLAVLAPDDGSRFRLLAIGRKVLRERFWGFVDAVLHDRRDMEALLAAQTYGTKTLGLRHLPAARPLGSGSYFLGRHDDHTHLDYTLRHVVQDDPVAREIALPPSASYIVTIANPDPGAWGLVEAPPLQQVLFGEEEVHITLPTPFPAPLQSQFRGRRYAQLDRAEWLDHPGAELVFIEG